MAEDAFVRMLLVAAGGHVTDERDVELARAAGAWAYEHGWRPYLGDCQGFVCGRNGLEFWVDGASAPDALLILVRLQPGTGWKIHCRYPVANLGHALNVLVAEELLPDRFSTIGRRALEDHAAALERSAAFIRRRSLFADSEGWVEADVLDQAAASARRFAGAQLAVLS